MLLAKLSNQITLQEIIRFVVLSPSNCGHYTRKAYQTRLWNIERSSAYCMTNYIIHSPNEIQNPLHFDIRIIIDEENPIDTPSLHSNLRDRERE